MSGIVRIDCFPEAAEQYADGWAIVAIDVIRATTTAITAAELGRRVYPVPTIEAALPIAARLDSPLLVGELGGNMPYGFDLTNSPAAIAARRDAWRPMILLSSSGTQLVHNAARVSDATYLGSLRNVSALVDHLAGKHAKIAVIGAGTRGEFRDEDQFCCARIAEGLAARGCDIADDDTRAAIDRWQGTPDDAWLGSKSVDYLRRTNQEHDLEFVLSHIDDLRSVFGVVDGEVVPRLSTAPVRGAQMAEI